MIDHDGGAKNQSIENLFENAYIVFTSDPQQLGGSWTQEEDTTVNRNGMDIHSVTKTIYTLESMEEYNGFECLKINAATSGPLDGSGNQMGNEMTFEGDLESSQTVYFEYRTGMIIYISSELFIEATIAVHDMNLPFSQEITGEFKLIK